MRYIYFGDLRQESNLHRRNVQGKIYGIFNDNITCKIKVRSHVTFAFVSDFNFMLIVMQMAKANVENEFWLILYICVCVTIRQHVKLQRRRKRKCYVWTDHKPNAQRSLLGCRRSKGVFTPRKANRLGYPFALIKMRLCKWALHFC